MPTQSFAIKIERARDAFLSCSELFAPVALLFQNTSARSAGARGLADQLDPRWTSDVSPVVAEENILTYREEFSLIRISLPLDQRCKIRLRCTESIVLIKDLVITVS